MRKWNRNVQNAMNECWEHHQTPSLNQSKWNCVVSTLEYRQYSLYSKKGYNPVQQNMKREARTQISISRSEPYNWHNVECCRTRFTKVLTTNSLRTTRTSVAVLDAGGKESLVYCGRSVSLPNRESLLSSTQDSKILFYIPKVITI